MCWPHQPHSALLPGACWGRVSSSQHTRCMELRRCSRYASANTVATKHFSYEKVLTVCENRSGAASFCPAADPGAWRRGAAAAGAEAASAAGSRGAVRRAPTLSSVVLGRKLACGPSCCGGERRCWSSSAQPRAVSVTARCRPQAATGRDSLFSGYKRVPRDGRREPSAELCQEDPLSGFLCFWRGYQRTFQKPRVSANTEFGTDRRRALTGAVRSAAVAEPASPARGWRRRSPQGNRF